jgi:8-oxo-dGTP diphosphatase
MIESQEEPMPEIQLLGRVVILEGNQILVARQIGESNTFLPGGHVEWNESVSQTICREAQEEFGEDVHVTGFIGVLEHAYQDRGKQEHEINFVFAGGLRNSPYPQSPISREGHLEFFWQPVEKLAEVNLLPEPMIGIIQNYYKNGKGSLWISSMSSIGI